MSNPDNNAGKTELTGSDLKNMFLVAQSLLENHADVINRLNVFPVPDGDTGTNMTLTLRDMINRIKEFNCESAGEMAQHMSRGAMMGSRGNSGLIMSQLFKGIAEAFDGKEQATASDVAQALQIGSERAYSVLANPVEGTILTVFAETSRAVQYEETNDITTILEKACASSREAVELTPTQLPRLQEAGVVDAGGLGLYVILEGMRHYLLGIEAEEIEISLPTPEGFDMDSIGVSVDFLDATEDELYGCCTQFVIEGSQLSLDDVRSHIEELGLSTVVIGDEAAVKVHVHTEEPERILEYARSLGTVEQVSVQNMDEQREKFEAERRTQILTPAGIQPIAIIAVAWGEGLENIFREQGASVMVAGDTMNPSVQEIVEAVENAPSEKVIFLPNNSNIVGTAELAKELIDKELEVIPTRSIPQGIAAILEFIPDQDMNENVSRMSDPLDSIRTAEVCAAARSVEMNGIVAEEGQIIGMFERELAAAGDDPVEVMVTTLRNAEMSDVELITLYWGEPLSQEDADEARERIEAEFPEVEVELVPGKQPYYHFIASLE